MYKLAMEYGFGPKVIACRILKDNPRGLKVKDIGVIVMEEWTGIRHLLPKVI